jgi:Nucleoside 2-deoxyribosyltransferase like
MNNIIIKSPGNIHIDSALPSVFLGGSIEMGKAEDWQAIIAEQLDGFVIYNPRRENWNPDWKQEITNPPFKEQVDWELDALDKADTIIMYFSPGTYSPISLLELGLYAHSNKLLVVCPEGFWRKGNVDIVCQRYGIQQFTTIDEVCQLLNKKIDRPSARS